MRRLPFWFLIALCSLSGGVVAGDDPVTFYVQLLRGTNEEKSEDIKIKEVGPKLRKKLSPVFRWKNYWEVSRTAVTVGKGKTGRVQLPNSHALEIELLNPAESEVRLYLNGALRRKSRQPIHNRTTIMGGDNNDDCWFVVVRRDPPQ
jgi:hypothetical protein